MEVLRKTGRILTRKSDYTEVVGECTSSETVGGNEQKSNTSLPSSQVQDNVISETAVQLENNSNESVMIATRDRKSVLRSEKFKALCAFALVILSFFLALISLALTHDKLPDRRIYKPLPDVVLDNVKSVDFLLKVSEVQIIVVVNVCVVMVFFHKHRFVIAKRCFFLLSILYFYRSITMFVTVLPISSETYYCSPKSNATTTFEVIKRALTLFSGMGLSINNKQIYCGDSIYSGHSVILILGYLVINKYTPKKLRFLSWMAALNAVCGITFLLLSHSHYTIDVIIAYYITTRLFWTYHSLCQVYESSSTLEIRNEWWMFLFNFFESNSRTISNEFEWPFKTSS